MVKRTKLFTVISFMIIFGLFVSCNLPGTENQSFEVEGNTAANQAVGADVQDGSRESVNFEQPAPRSDAEVQPVSLIQPEDIVYLGAFRLPGSQDEDGWAWGGGALTFYPGGDPDGPDDGFPGSLFGTGHDYHQNISEIAIPAPVISPSKNLEELPVAVVLQGFQDIRGDLLDLSTYELPRVGLEYLPPQGDQETGKLYFAWGEHYEDVFRATHGWAELDLSDPQTAGLWYFGKTNNYSTNDYIFAIDPAWAEIYTPGLGLVSGRYRDGGWSGQGPALFAYGPWNEGDPPQPGATIFAFPLLLYGSTLDGPSDLMMDNYHHSDEWNGGAWLTAGDRTAVIFVGTKGIGEYWYGFSNGVVWPDEAPFPEIPDPPHDNRGWWSNSFQAQMIFYDPSDLARVATGQMVPSEPQPYAVLDLDDFMFELEWDLQKYRIGPVAYDREHGLLYILELFGDGDKPLVHVFRIGP